MTQQRLPFSDGLDNDPEFNKGLKLKNKINPENNKPNFEERADAVVDVRIQRNKKVISLAKQFIDLVKDRTLNENRTEIAKNIENQVINDLIRICTEIDYDETEVEGIGTAALVNLLSKIALIQRDKINRLDYEISAIKKEMSRPKDQNVNKK